MMSPAAGDDDISTDDANQNTLYPTGEDPPELVKTVEEQGDLCEDAECKIDSVIEEVGREGKCDDVDSCSTNGNVPACQPDSEATQDSELATNPEKVQEISPVELSSQEGENHNSIEKTATESSILTDETVAQNSRLKRKKAVKIKRSKTDEGLKELSFMRCNSLLDIDQTKSAREASHSLGHRRSLVHDPELLRLEIAPSPFPSSSLAAFYPSDNDPYFSPPAPPLEGNFSPPVASDSCFSPPIGEPRQPRLLGRDGMNAAAAAAKKTKSPPPGPVESGGGCRTLFQRQKSVSGPMTTMSGGGRDAGFPDDGSKKRTSVFRRKSSLADDESDRKPLTKRIFGPSKMSLQVLRKYSLASEYFTLRFESGEEQIVPAIKGISLWQAISELMQRHGVNSFEQVDVFLDSSKTPLPPTSDCFLLANTVLWVKAKDELKRPETNNIRSSLSVSNLSLLSNATDSVKEKRPSNGMFLKRTDPSSFSSSNPTVDSPVVHHIRSTQRPKSAPMKNEPHPLALPPSSLPSPAPPRSPQPDGLGPRQSLLCPPSSFSSSSAEESVKTKKSVSSEDGSSLFDVSPSASLSHNDLLQQRNRGATTVATVATTGATVTGGGGGGATNATAATKGHSKLQSLFGPFNKVQDKHEQLTDLLNNYSQIGLPKMPDLLTLGRPNYDPQTFYIEPHWTDIVANHHTLSKRQRDQQEAIWELFTTEVEYIHKMKVIMDLFMCCLFNLQNEQILNEIEAEKLFSNIGDVFYSTCHFWKIHMSQVLKQARARRELLNPCLLKAGFLVFEKIFDPYTKYCLEQDNCREYIKQKTKENELFRTFISWAESQKQCNRLKLVDLIVKPFQRLTKYKLLLYAIKKPLDKMDSTTDAEEQKRDIGTMIEQVENFVFKVNVAMRQRHDYKQLLHMIERIEAYDAIEAPSEECFKLVSKFCKLDLTCPVPGCGQQQMRVLLLEGSLKLRDTYSKMDVYCFLFTDMLLITKPVAKRADRVKVIKPPMRLDKIVVHRLRDVASFMLLYLNEYHMAQAVYTFHGDSKLWLENVIKAQNDYKEKRNNYLTRTDAYDDIIDDVVCVELQQQQQQQQQPSPASTVKRHDSSGSADTFLPNYGVQRSTSCTKEDQDNYAGTEVRSGGNTPALHTLALPYRAQLSVPYGRAENEKVSSSSESLSKELEGDQFFTVPVLPSGNVVMEARRENPDDFELEVEEEGEELVDGIRESKFRSANQRRGARGERRYLTADTIQDLKTDKLRNVQKRLSWNCARFEDKDRDKGVLVGAESLRSMPSSSGVSSTASLYVVADGENGLPRGGALLSEDEEEEEDARCSSNSAVLSSYSSSSYSSSSYRRAGKLRSVETQTSDFGDGLLANFGKSSKVGEYFVESFVESSTRSLSQSLPDIAEFAVSKEEGGARRGANEDLPGGASIPSTPRVLLRRGLSSSQSSGMNQEFLLFNSTLEASDV